MLACNFWMKLSYALNLNGKVECHWESSLLSFELFKSSGTSLLEYQTVKSSFVICMVEQIESNVMESFTIWN